MRPTDELIKEHSAISVMLDILVAACEKLSSGETVDADDLEHMLAFFKGFADGCHHRKEEQYLFPELEKIGIGRERGPVGVMLAEHDLGRKYIKGMTQALEEMKRGDGQSVPAFTQNARAYVNLLRAHIEKENNVLFPMAEMHLGNEAKVRLAEGFEVLEKEEIGEGRHEELHGLLGILKAEYLG